MSLYYLQDWPPEAACPVGFVCWQGDNLTTVEAVEKAMPCVVNIATAMLVERNDPYYRMMREFYGDRVRRQVWEEPAASGSGVIIDEAGYLITNIHVIQGATKIQVKLADGRVYEAQRGAGQHGRHDRAGDDHRR